MAKQQKIFMSKTAYIDQVLAFTHKLGASTIILGALTIIAPPLADALFKHFGTFKGSTMSTTLVVWLFLDVIPSSIIILFGFKLRNITTKTLSIGHAISKNLIIVLAIQCVLWVLSGVGLLGIPNVILISFVRNAWFKLGQAEQNS